MRRTKIEVYFILYMISYVKNTYVLSEMEIY